MYSQRKLIPENDALDVVDHGDIKLVVSRLKPVNYKVTRLNADNLNKTLINRNRLLTVKEANRLFKSFPKWQFSIDSRSNSSQYLFGQKITDSSALMGFCGRTDKSGRFLIYPILANTLT
jgi:hypothetical protein